MERLTKRHFSGLECEPYVDSGIKCHGDSYEGEVINRLAELEDKLESGKLIEIPCVVGDTLYEPYEDGIDIDIINKVLVTIDSDMGVYELSDIGEMVFLSEAEAELERINHKSL